MGAKLKRRRLVVDPKMQFRLVLRIGWYLVLWTLAAFHVSFLFYLYATFLRGGAHRDFAGLYVDFFAYEKPLVTTLVVLAPLVLYDILKFSHRISGPLYRCRRVMRDMAAGKTVDEFKARERDFLDDVFVDFNALIRAWNARVRSDQRIEKAIDEGGHEPTPAAVAGPAEISW
jgi:hypothetical protein